MEIKKMKVREIKPAPYNPRSISDKSFEGLKYSIQKFGLVEPLVINKRTGFVVGGNQRLKALKDLYGDDYEVPVVMVDLDEDEEVKLNIALNNPAIQGKYDVSVIQLVEKIRQKDLLSYDKLLLQQVKKGFKTLLENAGQNYNKYKVIEDMEIQPYEHYDYVIVMCDNINDWNWLCEFLNLKKVKFSNLKKGKAGIGLGRAVRFQTFKKKLDEYVSKQRVGSGDE